MNKKIVLQKFSQLYFEIKKVYSDCSMDFDSASKLRQLDYCSNKFVCIDTAVSILSDCMSGYNNFTPDLLNNLKEIDESGRVYIAREGSVAIYFVSDLTEEEKKVVEYLENNSYGTFYGSPIKPNEKSQKTIKNAFKTSSSVSKKMLADECNLSFITSTGRIYNSCDGHGYIISVTNNIYPQNIPLDPNTKVFRFWWD